MTNETIVLPDMRVVLLRTSHSGNIGATARAMKNMGLTQLALVQPRTFPHADATARASGADDLLADAKVCATLEEAIADCVLIIGASARVRSLPVPMLDPRQCAEKIQRSHRQGKVAVLFGNEQSGLSNEELDVCHHLVKIPTNPDYASLNLAAAVQVICYEIRMATTGCQKDNETQALMDLATAGQVDQFFEHLEATLIEIQFLDPEMPRQLMRRLRRLFGRVQMDQNEVNILRGILTAVGKYRHRSGN